MSSMVRASLPTSRVPSTGIEVEKSPCTEPFRSFRQLRHRTCDLLPENHAGEHRKRAEYDRGNQEALHETADRMRRSRPIGSRASSNAIASPVEAKTGKLAA